jgi:hypothetical protein
MPTYLTSDAGAQDGFKTSGGLWDETSTTMGGSSTNPLGLRFKLHSSFDSFNRPLDPNYIWPTFDITLYLSAAPATSCILFLQYLAESAPAAFSDSLLPDGRGAVLMVDSNGAPTTQTIAQGTASGTAVTFSGIPSNPFIPYIRSSAWNGYIGLVFSLTTLSSVFFHTSRATNPAFAPKLTTSEAKFHTGHLDGPAFGRRARLVHCPRTGMPLASDELVRDGYNDGMMVSPEGWDPEDAPDRYAHNPLEGVVDDEV